MRTWTAAALATAALAGAASAATPRTGLHGTVVRGPTTPVCRAGTPCHAPAAHLRLTFVAGARSLVTTTDAEGRYSVSLAPGTYVVRAAVAFGHVRPGTVTVPAGAPRAQNFVLDTGIR